MLDPAPSEEFDPDVPAHGGSRWRSISAAVRLMLHCGFRFANASERIEK
jgi:hypothetical protein